MKKLLSAILLAMLSQYASAAPESYSYAVYVLPPFGTVTINNSIQCPNPNEHAKCLVSDQSVGSVITITGTKDHACYMQVQENGAVTVDESRSVFCTVETKTATSYSLGEIHLQKHF